MINGTDTSFVTETELDEASMQAGSENVALATIESSAKSKTVPLNSSQVMPEMDSATTTMGVRVGLGVGMGVGTAVVGPGVGRVVGTKDGRGVGGSVGAGLGAGVGTELIGADDGTNVGEKVCSGDGTSVFRARIRLCGLSTPGHK